MGVLDGRKVIAVGASAGIGRAFALEAVKAGAEVLAVARRQDRLDDLVKEAGGGLALAADISTPGDCVRIGDTAARELGEVDLLMHCAGVAPLQRLKDTTAEEWQRVLGTNVIGLHQVIRAVLPVMRPGGIVSGMSSEVIGRPRTALGAYGSSKAALEGMMEVWRVEHPGMRFTTIQIGSVVPTEFGNTFDLDLLTEVMGEWAAHGQAQQDFMAVDEVGLLLVNLFAAMIPFPGICLEHMIVRSPSAVVASADAMIEHAESTIPH